MTSHELQAHGISRAVINRAVKAGEVLDEAVVVEVTDQPLSKKKSGRRLVFLYHLYPDQLETRKDGVYVPLSGLDERDQEKIKRYIEGLDREASFCIGNVERELGLDLSGPSETCRRRRDYLLKVARDKGIELREGVDESRPVTGSIRWWTCHIDEVEKELDELRSNLPEIKCDVAERSLRRHECDQFEILESILKKPILEHLGAQILSRLGEIFTRMKRTGSFDSMGFLRDGQPPTVQKLYEDMRQIIEKVDGLLEDWFTNGLTGDCEKCRSVRPKASSFFRRQS
jgi:hypothetical protein